MTAQSAAYPAPRSGIARATAFGFLAEAMVFPVGLVTAAFLTRKLGVSDYGRLSLVYAVLSPVVWLASSTFAGRTGVALLTSAGDWRPMAATLLRANALVGVVTMLGFAVLVPWLAAGVGSPSLVPLLWVAAFEIALLPVTRIHRDALFSKGQYSWPAVATLAFHLARLALVLVLVAAGWSLLGVVLANLGARAIELITCWVRIRLPMSGSVRGWLSPVRAQVRSLFGYALCLQLFNRIDILLLGILAAPGKDLGHYGAAQNLALAPGLLALVLSPMIIAALRRAELASAPAEAAALRHGSSRLALACWALAGPVAAGAPELVVLLFGESFAAAGPILGWLGMGAGAGLVLSVWSAHQVAARRFARPLAAAVPMLLVAVALQAAFIPTYGALGAAWATALASLLAAVIALASDGLRQLPARMFDLARTATAATAGFFATQMAARAGVPSPADLVLGAIITVASLVAVKLTSRQDLRALASEVTSRTPIETMP